MAALQSVLAHILNSLQRRGHMATVPLVSQVLLTACATAAAGSLDLSQMLAWASAWQPRPDAGCGDPLHEGSQHHRCCHPCPCDDFLGSP